MTPAKTRVEASGRLGGYLGRGEALRRHHQGVNGVLMAFLKGVLWAVNRFLGKGAGYG